MWWPAIGGYCVGAMGSYLFNNVSFLSYVLTLTPFVNGFGELLATLISYLGCRVGTRLHGCRMAPSMQNPGYVTVLFFFLLLLLFQLVISFFKLKRLDLHLEHGCCLA